MTRAKSPGPPRSETLYSSALYLKKLEVVENAGSRGSHIFSGTRIKSVLIPFLFWLLKHTPLFVALLPLRLIVATMQLLYGWRKNTLRQSCEYICVLSKQAGYNHEPRQIYRKMLNNMLAVVQNYFQLYRDGLEAHLDRVELSPEQSALMNKLVSDHDGLMMAVPHNFGSGFSSFKLHRAFPLVLIGRNPSTIARTRVVLNMFERMQVSVLMVRGGNPFELSRTLFSVLRSSKVLAATLDNVVQTDHCIKAQIFGKEVGFPFWAAKIAARMEVPVIPCYFHSDGRQITPEFGQPLVSKEPEVIVQHYVSFFEQKILEDPASWAYLGDKRWRRVLREAARAKQ